jgi:hypothetical protein
VSRASSAEGHREDGRHAFTVTAAAGEEEMAAVKLLRLDPDDLDVLPHALARRLRQLANATAAATSGAMQFLASEPHDAGEKKFPDINHDVEVYRSEAVDHEVLRGSPVPRASRRSEGDIRIGRGGYLLEPLTNSFQLSSSSSSFLLDAAQQPPRLQRVGQPPGNLAGRPMSAVNARSRGAGGFFPGGYQPFRPASAGPLTRHGAHTLDLQRRSAFFRASLPMLRVLGVTAPGLRRMSDSALGLDRFRIQSVEQEHRRLGYDSSSYASDDGGGTPQQRTQFARVSSPHGAQLARGLSGGGGGGDGGNMFGTPTRENSFTGARKRMARFADDGRPRSQSAQRARIPTATTPPRRGSISYSHFDTIRPRTTSALGLRSTSDSNLTWSSGAHDDGARPPTRHTKKSAAMADPESASR